MGGNMLGWMKVIVALGFDTIITIWGASPSCLMSCPKGSALGERMGDQNQGVGARTCVEFWMW